MTTPSDTALAAAPEADEIGAPTHPRSWIPSLEGVRGLAILMVMLFHYGPELNRNSFPQHMFKLVGEVGWTGVDLFFVLSGFLITGILLDSRRAENYFSSFYFRRVLRIFPVYYLSLFVIFFLFPVLMPGDTVGYPLPQERIWHFAYLQNWFGLLIDGTRQRLIGHHWSLGIEEQFYLIWPLVVYKSTEKRILQIAAGVCAASLILRLSMLAMHVHPEIIYRNTFTRMDSLLIGAACTCLVRNPVCVEYLRRYAGWMWLAPIAILEGLREITRPFAYQAPGVEALGFTLIALSYAALVIGVVLTKDSRSMVQRFFCSGIMKTFGKYSYAAYVWHLMVRMLVLNFEARLHLQVPALINIPLMIALTLLVSVCSYVIVEQPFLALKRHFEPRFPALRDLHRTTNPWDSVQDFETSVR